MSTTKRNRKDNKVESSIIKNATKINAVNDDVKKLKKEYDTHILRHILDDLQQERFVGSDKPLYTYQEIADRHNTSPATVTRIASEHGLQRRGNKTV